MPQLIVRRPGLLTTVQDAGRWGYQDFGMPVAGPMDAYSHRAANLLVGNPADAAVLEVTLLGPELQFESESLVAVAGALFAVSVDGRALPFHAAATLGAGSLLRFGERVVGARAYLAVSGGIQTPPVIGSRSTHIPSRTGGFQGRALRAGDVLQIGEAAIGVGARPRPLELPKGAALLRVMPGPHAHRFGTRALDLLASFVFRISPQSNRIGYRLEGARIEQENSHDELISVAMPLGAVQVPRLGEPILLMADHGTTGGYPVVAVVITADLPIAGQLAPGDSLQFACCSADEAQHALAVQEAALLS